MNVIYYCFYAIFIIIINTFSFTIFMINLLFPLVWLIETLWNFAWEKENEIESQSLFTKPVPPPEVPDEEGSYLCSRKKARAVEGVINPIFGSLATVLVVSDANPCKNKIK